MSAIADVYDMDCIVSFVPLKLGLTAAFTRGASAIMRRILRRWCILVGSDPDSPDLGVPVPILDMDGVTLSRDDLQAFRASLEKQARDESFVSTARVSATLSDSGLLSISAIVTLEDGLTYSLEVGAAGAINELGGFKFSQSSIDATIAFLKANPTF